MKKKPEETYEWECRSTCFPVPLIHVRMSMMALLVTNHNMFFTTLIHECMLCSMPCRLDSRNKRRSRFVIELPANVAPSIRFSGTTTSNSWHSSVVTCSLTWEKKSEPVPPLQFVVFNSIVNRSHGSFPEQLPLGILLWYTQSQTPFKKTLASITADCSSIT